MCLVNASLPDLHIESINGVSQKYDTKGGEEEGDGFLDAEEITALAKDLGHTNIKKRTIKYFMKQLDKNGDNKISFEGNTIINNIFINFYWQSLRQ